MSKHIQSKKPKTKGKTLPKDTFEERFENLTSKPLITVDANAKPSSTAGQLK